MAETRCANCGEPMSDSDTVCPACGAPAAGASPAARDAAPDIVRHRPNFAGVAKLVALLFFLLPWVTVSCQAQRVASPSGFQIAAGAFSTGNAAEAANNPFAEPYIPLAIAGILIVLGLLAAFLLVRKWAALVGLVASVAALALSAYSILVGLKDEIGARMSSTEGPGGESMPAEMKAQFEQMLRVEIEIGFWLTLVALAAAAALNLLVFLKYRRSPSG